MVSNLDDPNVAVKGRKGHPKRWKLYRRRSWNRGLRVFHWSLIAFPIVKFFLPLSLRRQHPRSPFSSAPPLAPPPPPQPRKPNSIFSRTTHSNRLSKMASMIPPTQKIIILGSPYPFDHPTISKSKATSFSHIEKIQLRKRSKFQVENIPFNFRV